MHTVDSFFTGCGGLDIGLEGGFHYLGKYFEPNGFKTVFSCDIKPSAKLVYDAYFGPKDGRSLTLESIVDLVKEHEINPVMPRADVVTGGFPCQDFSLAGKRRGFASFKNHLGEKVECVPEESRGMLYFWMCKAVYAIRPLVVIAENVKGLDTIDGAKEKIMEDFTAMGYHTSYKIILASDYGVPQKRERIVFIGVRKDALSAEALSKTKQGLGCTDLITELMPIKTHEKPLTCRDAFKGLSEPEGSDDPDQAAVSGAAYLAEKKKAEKTDVLDIWGAEPEETRLMGKGQGQTEICLDRPGPTIRSEHHGNIEYRRLSLEHGGKLVDELGSGLKERRLTVKECGRLQSFPDDYKFLPTVSGSEAYRLIGNAVPPVLGHAIGKQLAAKWNFLFGETK